MLAFSLSLHLRIRFLGVNLNMISVCRVPGTVRGMRKCPAVTLPAFVLLSQVSTWLTSFLLIALGASLWTMESCPLCSWLLFFLYSASSPPSARSCAGYITEVLL